MTTQQQQQQISKMTKPAPNGTAPGNRFTVRKVETDNDLLVSLWVRHRVFAHEQGFDPLIEHDHYDQDAGTHSWIVFDSAAELPPAYYADEPVPQDILLPCKLRTPDQVGLKGSEGGNYTTEDMSVLNERLVAISRAYTDAAKNGPGVAIATVRIMFPSKINTSIYEHEASIEGSFARLGRLAALPQSRGLGVGKLLMKSAEEYAKNTLNAGSMVLHAQDHKRRFYESCGFVVHGEDKTYIEEDYPHYLMAKKLN
ncbi:acyl-CoA N-acyltransferase [Ramicandelaber brevisporus]|nr:acyl-CoA N-acyltransferase [Ramicandelaber brevisporus]